MSWQIVSTKLYKPVARPQTVSRQRLLGLLDTGRSRKLTLVSAGAGYGKSTVVGLWAQDLANVAWVSLDRGDSDFVRFLAHVLASIQTITADFGSDIQAALLAPHPPSLDYLMVDFVNALAAFPEGVTLVLDDYHTLNNPDIDHALTLLIEQAPPHFHLILITRQEPALPLPRLRARGQLTELKADQLRFTEEETAEFLNNIMALNLSAATVATLAARSEGWIAGLQLAALSWQQRSSTHPSLTSISGSHHFIADYLFAELFAQQSTAVQEFLLKTALFEQLCGPLCEALLNLPAGQGQAILQMLQQANLFIVPLDEERCWYRYHHLLRDYLRTRQLDVAEQARLRGRAARWYAENGRFTEAVECGLLAEDWAWVMAQLSYLHGKLWAYHEVAQFRDWCLCLPPEQLAAAPHLHIHFVWGQLALGDLVTVRRHLPQLEQRAPTIDDPEWLGLLGIIQANETAEHDPQAAISLYEKALRQLPAASVAWRGGAYISFGLTLLQLDDLEQSQAVLEQAIAQNQAAGNVHGVIFCLYHLGEVQRQLGHLNQALATHERGLALATQADGSLWLIGAWSLLGKGQVLWQQQREALPLIVEAVQMGKRSHDHKLIVSGLLLLARVQMAHGYVDEAWELWQRAEVVAQKSQMRSLVKSVQVVKAELGQVDRAVMQTAVIRPTARQALIEPLSDTELVLLRMVAEGCTNRQIADQRTITLNTVKWHLKNIYGKLGVRNRTGAVAEGRKLGLL